MNPSAQELELLAIRARKFSIHHGMCAHLDKDVVTAVSLAVLNATCGRRSLMRAWSDIIARALDERTSDSDLFLVIDGKLLTHTQ